MKAVRVALLAGMGIGLCVWLMGESLEVALRLGAGIGILCAVIVGIGEVMFG